MFMTVLVKYPKTLHLPWSPGAKDDDISLSAIDNFIGKHVIVTEKMDGENTTMYSDDIHARSLDGRHHVSRDWVKQFWGKVSRNIPEDYRICGENLYAKHSIKYTNLDSYFLGFSVWNESNICLSWEETEDVFFLLGICYVPVLYTGIFDEKKIKEVYNDSMEGYVIRLAEAFPFDQFSQSVAKFVRENHVQTDEHWMQKEVEKNLLRERK
jgi:hypothetical protein